MNTRETKVKPNAGWWSIVAALLTVVVVLAFVVSADNAVTRADASIIEWIAGHRPAWIVDAARAVTLLGHGAILAGLLIAACVVLARRGVLPLRAALLPPIALAIGGGLNPLLKAIIDRPRPPVDLRITTELSSGFPSGHSTQSACAWIALALVLWLWGRGHPRWPLAVAAALAAAIGLTRIVLGVHSPTDVVAGWAWGTAVALTVVGIAAYAERATGARSSAAGPAPPTDPLPSASVTER